MTLFRASLAFFLLTSLGCSAQSVPSDLDKRIQREVRGYYNLPADVDVTIGPLKPSEFPNYRELTVTLHKVDRKQELDFLLSKDEKTLIRITKMDLSKDPYVETMNKIDTRGRPRRGNKDAKVVAINYDDFQCPFCSRMHEELFPTLFKEYGDRVLFIYKDYPLAEIHPWAIHAAVDANCLSAESTDAYWDFADYIHANQKDVNREKSLEARFAALDKITLTEGQKYHMDVAKLQSCIQAQKDDAVRASMKEAETLGVSATPTMFVNGEKVDGALPLSELRSVFDRALRETGTQPSLPLSPPATPAPGAARSKGN